MTRSVAQPGLALAVALGLAASSGVGCGSGAEGGCPALASCGGDPTGTWKAAAADACQYRPVRPAQPADVNAYVGKGVTAPTFAPPQPQPVMLQQSTSGDWCSDLVYSGMPPISYVNLWHDAPAFAGGQVSFNPDRTYSVKLTFSTPGYANGGADPDAGTGTGAAPGPGSNTTHFAPICLLAYGANPSCDDLAKGLTAFYAPVPPATASFQNIRCEPAPSDGGCDCSYVYVVVVQDSGNWSVSGDTLLEDSTMGTYSYNGLLLTTQGAPSQVPTQPMLATFCKQNGQLMLTGARGSSLSWVTGLRTMKLTPM